MRPLGKLLVAKSYSTRVGEKTTKTDAVKHVPVHPTLAAMLAEWKLGGWAAMMGRAPGPDDLIVPLPPDVAERRTKVSVRPSAPIAEGVHGPGVLDGEGTSMDAKYLTS